jgi:transposase-like protein
MPARKRRSFATEHKVEAADRVIDSGRTIAEVARESGLNDGLLSTWVEEERRRLDAAAAHGEQPLDAAERPKLLRLRWQVAEQEKNLQFLVGDRERREFCCAYAGLDGQDEQRVIAASGVGGSVGRGEQSCGFGVGAQPTIVRRSRFGGMARTR